ncbi:MAG: ATP-dependent helicase HrpB [Myxococcaceae bacterium]
MSIPMAEVAAQEVVKALNNPQTQTTQKSAESKFDGVLADKASGATPSYLGPGTFPGEGLPVTSTRPVESVLRVNNVEAPDSAATTSSAIPVAGKEEPNRLTEMMTKVMGDLESGQMRLDSLINSGLSGQDMSATQLLSLQANMYKYVQEMELTGKVVEKATNGLKDTLKTQV